ncbi:MAG: response regulator transcription factor [Planctomycetes bacterium]|nr:response regulator transcription factor [Planctomycetota bacterium]
MKILIVDDDPKLRAFVSKGLDTLGHTTSAAGSGLEARNRLAAQDVAPDLILLDVMMPGGDGMSFLEELRRCGTETPVIFVSAARGVEDRVRGLRLGADDFLVKPFQFDELLARIEAVARRRARPLYYEVGELRLSPLHRSVDRAGERIDLSPKEFDLLRTLVEARGRTLSRVDLLRIVWGMHFDPRTNVVDALVARLRRRLDRGEESVIETVFGEGYRVAPPREVR